MFLDEVGASLKPVTGRTWAPKGETPIVTHSFNWSSLSVIGAITSDGRVFQHARESSIKATDVVAFLAHLLRHVDGKLVVVCDRAGIHRAGSVRAFLEANPRLSLVHTPAYAPECNPIEWLWAWVKRGLQNLCARTLDELRREWRLALLRARNRPGLVASFFRASAIGRA